MLAHVLTHSACIHARSLQSRPTLCDPMDCSPPGSSVHWILQARILEWVGMPSSRGSSRLRDHACISQISCTGMRALHHCAARSTHQVLTVTAATLFTLMTQTRDDLQDDHWAARITTLLCCISVRMKLPSSFYTSIACTRIVWEMAMLLVTNKNSVSEAT